LATVTRHGLTFGKFSLHPKSDKLDKQRFMTAFECRNDLKLLPS
jgi:hypothetical protein